MKDRVGFVLFFHNLLSNVIIDVAIKVIFSTSLRWLQHVAYRAVVSSRDGTSDLSLSRPTLFDRLSMFNKIKAKVQTKKSNEM